MFDLILNDNHFFGSIPPTIVNHPQWDRLALQMIRQRPMDGTNRGFSYDKDIRIPDFIFTDLRDGSRKSLRELYASKKMTMLLAWDPTQEESNVFMETIVRRLHTLYSGQDFAVVAITPEGEPYRTAAVQYLADHPVAWPVISEYIDEQGRRIILPSYPYPSYLLVDQYGKLTHDYFNGKITYNMGEVEPLDLLSFNHSDDLGGILYSIFGHSEYESTDFSRDKTYETLQTATRGKGLEIALLGDVFTDIEIDTGYYKQLMEFAMESLFSIEPMKSYRDYFNVRMIYAVSKKAYLGESRSSSALESCVNTVTHFVDPLLKTIRDDYLIVCPPSATGPRFVSILVNSNSQGIAFDNRGPTYAFSGTLPGDRAGTRTRLHHESVGHGIGWLGDEYWDFTSGLEYITDSQISRLKANWARGWNLNLSLTDDPTEVAWSHLIGHPNYPEVGIYEGGFNFSRGVWRSEKESIINSDFFESEFFSTIHRQLIVKRILDLSGEGYSFDKFLENDRKDIPKKNSSVSKSMQEKYPPSRHMPPVRIEE